MHGLVNEAMNEERQASNKWHLVCFNINGWIYGDDIIMDSVTEKFSVFDFFNLIIGGGIFLLGVGISNYEQAKMLFVTIAEWIGDSNFLLIIAIILCVGCSFVFGCFINEIAQWILEDVIQVETKIIKKCLSKDHLIKNTYRRKIFKRKAQRYFQKNKSTKDSTQEDKYLAYFTYCSYYLHVRNQDKKTEKIRETQNLAGLLTFAFVLIPISNFILLLLQLTFTNDVENSEYSVISISISFVICTVLSFSFIRRYIRATKNRIRMVLAVYDACTDMENSDKISY